MKKKMFFVVTAALIAVLIGFTSCSQSASSVLSGGKEDTPSVPPGTGGGDSHPSVPQKDLYGSYWGDMQVGDLKIEMCVVLKADEAAMKSTIMGKPYPVLTFKDEGRGIWTVECRSKKTDTKIKVKLTIDTTQNPFTCSAEIIPMGTTGYLKKGKDYKGEYDQQEPPAS